MAVEKIVTLCKEGDSTTEYYPNIKGDNIPSGAVAKGKLTQALQDEIDGKAPQSTTYTKTEIDNKLSGKVNVATYNAKVSELETAIGTKANASDVYSKTQVYTKTESDALLSAKANASDVYTKTATDTLLDGKANASSVYTKTETDTLLLDKANTSDVYTKTATDTLLNAKANADDVYTKTATDTLLSGKSNKLYLHKLSLSDENGDYLATINLISTSSDEISSVATLTSLQSKILNGGTGYDASDDIYYVIERFISLINGVIQFYSINLSQLGYRTYTFTISDITDDVTEL